MSEFENSASVKAQLDVYVLACQ